MNGLPDHISDFAYDNFSYYLTPLVAVRGYGGKVCPGAIVLAIFQQFHLTKGYYFANTLLILKYLAHSPLVSLPFCLGKPPPLDF